MKEWNYILGIFEKLWSMWDLKMIFGMIVAAGSFLFDPTQCMALMALFLLICADFAFGMAASKKTGKEITSARFYRTPVKMVVYFALIACSHVTEAALPAQMGFLDETVTGFLAATELISILENVGYLGYVVPRKLLNQLKKYTEEK